MDQAVDTGDLTDLERQQLRLIELYQLRKRQRKLFDYQPYPKQLDFHAAGRVFRERLFRAGNQCLVLDSTITTPTGERPLRQLIGQPMFDVMSWDGSQRVRAKAGNVQSMGVASCLRITLDDGKEFECSRDHAILFEGGRWETVDEFRASTEIDGVGNVKAYGDLSALEMGRRIVKIRSAGEQEVFCLQVDGTNCYEAYGAVHHNCGKTLSAAAETAFHLTGRYPDSWPGKRFTRATKGWVVSEDMKFSRDNAQRLLLGEPGEWGTGYIPAEYIVKIVRARHSVEDAVDTVLVRHASGRISKLLFKSAEVPRNKLGGDTLDFAWVDEEVPMDHYLEVITRTNVTQGPIYITFTPLKGRTPLVKRFMIDKVPGTADIVMTIHDSLHYSPEDIEAIIASYPAHQRRARTLGEPTMGAGLIFVQRDEDIMVKPFPIPDHWGRLIALDFGVGHPFAMAELVVDRDTDTTYIIRGYRKPDETPAQQVAVYREWGGWQRTAWPADGQQREKTTAVQVAAAYKKVGFNMLKEKAMLSKDDLQKGQSVVSVEAGLHLMNQALDTGKLKVFANVPEFFEEKGLYHRDENNQIVKVNDDFISACFHGDTEVLTPAGPIKIRDLSGTIGQVMTVTGRWTTFSWCGITKTNAPLVRISFEDGSSVLCTPEHKFLSQGEWVQARDLLHRLCDTYVSNGENSPCASKSCLPPSKNSTGKFIEPIPGDDTSPVVRAPCTETYGSSTGGKFLRSITSIICADWPTTKLKISNACLEGSIFRIIRKAMGGDSQQKQGLPKLYGSLQRKEKNSIGKWAFSMRRISIKEKNLIADSAERNSSLPSTAATNSAPTHAGQHGAEPVALMMSRAIASSAEQNFASTSITSRSIVRESAGLRVLSVREETSSTVYCLTVPETECFALSNGVIVHNCRYGFVSRRYATTKPVRGSTSLLPIDYNDRT